MRVVCGSPVLAGLCVYSCCVRVVYGSPVLAGLVGVLGAELRNQHTDYVDEEHSAHLEQTHCTSAQVHTVLAIPAL